MNPYAAKLNEFPDIAFNADGNFKNRGQWAGFFKNKTGEAPRKLVFEIGCSNGLFLCEAAKTSPDWAFVGIDWKYKVLYRAAKRAAHFGLKNVAFLRGKAEELPQVFGNGELDQIYLFFPDPWAKTAQLKHRLMQEGFLVEAAKALAPGGVLHFKTDHPGYFQWVLALFGHEQPSLDAYDQPELEEKSKRARQVRVRRLMAENQLPPVSPVLKGKFRVESISTDFWGGTSQENAPDMASNGPIPPFKQHKTFFEGLFIKEQLPIYYVQIKKI